MKFSSAGFSRPGLVDFQSPAEYLTSGILYWGLVLRSPERRLETMLWFDWFIHGLVIGIGAVCAVVLILFLYSIDSDK